MGNYFTPAMETAPLHEMKQWQSFNLSRTIRRVYDKVPLMRQRMEALNITPDDIRSIDDITKLPFTTKLDLRDTYPYGLFACDMSDVVRLHASSGTTGKQIVVGYTKRDVDIWAECTARALVSVGGGRNDVVHVSYGYGLFTGGLGLHYGAELLGAVTLPASSGNTARQITMIRDFGSTILCCTPSYALFIGDTFEQSGIPLNEIKLKAGLFGAEPWTENMRTEIEKRLGIKAYDIYGLSEISGPGVSFDCECQDGMHINEDHFYPEIINPETGEQLPDGEFGELVFTSITKEAFPLIRYRTRDITALRREKCSCGRTLVKMERLRGRTDDMLIIRGVNVFPSQIESVLLSLGAATPHYQMIVDRINNLDTLEVQIEMSDELFSDQVRKLDIIESDISKAIFSTLGLSAKVKLVEPKTIARSEGKAKRVIDKRNLS
ncbi:phenylacetate-coenzyme A ligase [Clostridia bacterium]|nr:phenylacetate-coenzyme A ligase [Clostridia bacterium]